MIKYMPKSVTEFVTESHGKSRKVTEIVTEIQTFNRDGVAYCQGTSLAVCTPLYTLFTVHISPSFYFAYIHLLLFGYHLNLSCSQ